MSYILDALKKAAEQRDVHTPALRRLFTPTAEIADAPRWRIALVGGGAAFAGAAVVGIVWLLWPTTPMIVAERPDAPAVMAEEPRPAVRPPAPPIVRTAPAPATVQPEKRQARTKPTAGSPVIAALRPPLPAAAEPAPVRTSVPPAAPDPASVRTPAPPAAPDPASVRTPAPPGAADPSPVGTPGPPAAADRASARTPAPAPAAPSTPPTARVDAGSPMKLEVIVYSDERARRLAFINGRKYVEGDILLDGTKIQEIQPNAVVILEGGRRVLLRP